MTDETDEFLAHYGVLGMHWGRRRADGRPVEYESKYTGRRDSAPSGPDRHGNYGSRIGLRGRLDSIKSPSRAREDRAARKAYEKETGHTVSQKNFDHNYKDPIRSDYTRAEVKAAKRRTAAAKKIYEKASYQEKLDLPWDIFNYEQTRDGVIAAQHEKGKRAALAVVTGAGLFAAGAVYSKVIHG